MRIRKYKDTDAAEIARLHRNTIRHVNSRDYSPEIIADWSSHSTSKLFRTGLDKCVRFVAVENGKIVGFCDHGFKGDLERLYVHKEHQGRGIGLKLLKKTEASLRNMNISIIKVQSTLLAKKFYEKCGYKFIKNDVYTMRSGLKAPICLLEKQLD